MFKHLLLICKVVTGVLVLVLLLEVRNGWVRSRPLKDLIIPEVPHLAGAPTNQPPAGAKPSPSSNQVAAANGTNSTAGAVSTNSKPVLVGNKADTNVSSGKVAVSSTNVVTKTNTVVSKPMLTATNSGASTNLVVSTNLSKSTNMVSIGGTNSTNRVASKSTNAPPPSMAGMNMGRPGMPGAKGPELPPIIQARMDKITQSEILGSVIRPMPMGLLGVAGNYAFMRAPNGQTGMIKEGDELGGLKLIKIGVNRVLVEQDGQKKELMIFSGFGSETLLPKLKETTNETAKTK